MKFNSDGIEGPIFLYTTMILSIAVPITCLCICKFKMKNNKDIGDEERPLLNAANNHLSNPTTKGRYSFLST